MNSKQYRTGKAVIAGADAVGSSFTYALAQLGIGDEIALLDARHELLMGQVRHEKRKNPGKPDIIIRESFIGSES
ncbi:MAG TPA: hypothetical protein DET40_16920 [Lentisphaeria bacterium]|nr:MAG: hypothetical protein A2X45_01450 [Lentisphaerae bacterium GWF2_50_93]HCE45224.1 hypothetical protein [Lentisphaeria bacterium]